MFIRVSPFPLPSCSGQRPELLLLLCPEIVLGRQSLLFLLASLGGRQRLLALGFCGSLAFLLESTLLLQQLQLLLFQGLFLLLFKSLSLPLLFL